MTQMDSLTGDVEPVPEGADFVIDAWKGYTCRDCDMSFQMHAMISHCARWPEEKYVTKLSEHSYPMSVLQKNKHARLYLAKKHVIDSCRACRRYLEEEAYTDDSRFTDLSRRDNEVDDSGRRGSRRSSGVSRRNSVPDEEQPRRRMSRRNSTLGIEKPVQNSEEPDEEQRQYIEEDGRTDPQKQLGGGQAR